MRVNSVPYFVDYKCDVQIMCLIQQRFHIKLTVTWPFDIVLSQGNKTNSTFFSLLSHKI